MGTYTFAEFKTYVKLNLGNNEEFESPTDYYAVWVNAAYIQLTTQDKFWGLKRSFYFPQLETSTSSDTTDGTAYVSVPTDCLVVRAIHDTTNTSHLKWISFTDYVRKTDRADTTAEGTSCYWTRHGSYIYLYPTPDDTNTLTIYYRKIPAVLSGTSTTAIGTEWDQPLVTLATHKAFMWTQDYDKAKVMKQEFLEQAGGIMAIYGQEEKARDEVWRIHPAYKTSGYRA